MYNSWEFLSVIILEVSALMSLISMMPVLAAAGATDSTASMFSSLLIPVAMLGVLYFVMFRPSQKKQKEEAKMRAAIEVGDEVVTIGGIIGIVVSIKDDTMVIETGTDRSKIRMLRAAIQQNNTPREAAAPAKSAKSAKGDKK